MNVTFKDKKFEKIANDHKLLQRAYGTVNAGLINRRLNNLRAATTLEDCRNLPGKYHDLVENWKYHVGVSIEQPMRIVFRPTDDPLPINRHGKLEWNKVFNVEIVVVENYHGK